AGSGRRRPGRPAPPRAPLPPIWRSSAGSIALPPPARRRYSSRLSPLASACRRKMFPAYTCSSPRARATSSATVVLPLPGSPEIVTSTDSLDVLHLLAQLFHLAFRFEHPRARLHVGRLGAGRVELAEDLLQQELDLFPGRCAPAQRRRERREMALQTHQLLGHVAAVRERSQLLCQARLIDPATHPEPGDAILHPLPQRSLELRQAVAD